MVLCSLVLLKQEVITAIPKQKHTCTAHGTAGAGTGVSFQFHAQEGTIRKENKPMSEEIKKEAQDVELNPEELDKVAGGQWAPDEWTPLCPKCKGYTKYFSDDEDDLTLICRSCGYKFLRDPWGNITDA